MNKMMIILSLVAAIMLNAGCPETEPIAPNCFDLAGKWESDFFEVNGTEATDLYQLSLEFSDYTCEQTLVKPGITFQNTDSYVLSSDCKTLTIGTAVFNIDKWEWADEKRF